MQRISLNRYIQHSQNDVYNIIINIKNYPQIFPYINKITILNKENEDEEQKTAIDEKEKTETKERDIIKAQVFVKLGLIEFSYKCTITTNQPNRIDILSTEGPFNYMSASWEFIGTKEFCNVNYEMKYEHKNTKIQKLFNIMAKKHTVKTIKLLEKYINENNPRI